MPDLSPAAQRMYDKLMRQKDKTFQPEDRVSALQRAGTASGYEQEYQPQDVALWQEQYDKRQK